MKILVFGANGQVGRELLKRGNAQNAPTIIGLTRKELDITDTSGIQDALQTHTPDLAINSAAYTAVDRAEQEPDAAYSVNRDAPSFLAKACSDASIPLFHISTDYVFDGNKQDPYTEDDPTCPIGIYGRSKCAGEEAVRLRLDRHIILRTSWVFSAHGSNFVKTMLRIGKQKEEIRVVNDQKGCPTAAADIAEALLQAAVQLQKKGEIPWGTYHYCGAPPISWHGFAERIFQIAETEKNFIPPGIVPIPTREYPTPAERPQNSVMDCGKIEEKLQIKPCRWEPGLLSVIRELES